MQETQRVAPDADVAVGQQHLAPGALGRQRAEHVPADHGRAAAPAQPLRDRGEVNPQRRYTALRQRGHEASGPAPEVDHRAGAAVEQPAVLAVGGPAPPRHREDELDTVVADEPGRRPGQGRIEGPDEIDGRDGIDRMDGLQVGVQHRALPTADGGSADSAGSPATAAAKRVPGASLATTAASAAVSTSVSSGSRPTRSPAARSA